MTNSVYITHTATALPNAPVGNAEMEKVLGQIGARPSRARAVILRSNGIQRRFYALDPAGSGQPTHTNAQLTAKAIQGLENEDFRLDQLQCLATGTSMPDQLLPNHGVMVHGELGVGEPEVVSMAGICLSGVTALKHAWLSVRAGESDSAVATGSETASLALHARNFKAESDNLIDALECKPEIAFDKDFLRWMLSDGAGAILLRPAPKSQGLSLRIDWIELASHAHLLPACMYAGASKRPDGTLQGWNAQPQQQWLADSTFTVKQDVRLLNDNIVQHTLAGPLKKHIAKHHLKASDIDWFLPHMSSNYFRQPLHDALKALDFDIAQERWFTNLAQMGNTGSASFYIMLDELFRSGRIRDGHKLLAFVPESGRFSSGFIHMTAVQYA